MALSKVSDATKVKDLFLKLCTQKDRNKFSLLIVGKTGVGKSSLVNALVGREVAEVGHDKKSKTKKVTSYDVDIDGVKIHVWDTPGLQDDDDDEEDEADDGTRNDEKYLAEMQSEIKEELDLVILCLRMDATRFRRDDKQTIKILTDRFGKELWKNAVIALTFADKVQDPARGDREAHFKREVAAWQDAINIFLRGKRIKLDPEWVQSLQLVPTGNYLSLTVLPNGEKWLSNFWIACYTIARKSATFNLYRINKGRLGIRWNKKFADVCGGSVVSVSVSGGSELARITPGLDSSKIPPIDLDEEQQESFWNTTWEAFKEYCSSIGVVLGVISTVGIAILRGFSR